MKEATRYHKGDKIGDRYLVHQALRGGMGEVYLCLDLETFQPYALKTFQSRFLTHPAMRQLFNDEVRHWVSLEKHPHIVRCFHMIPIANQPFMLLEWVASDEYHGTDLRSWLWRGPLPLRLALQFAIDICSGLIHAQSKQPGIVHRDLKPDNILVAQGEVAKITDWGLATVVLGTQLPLGTADAFETGGRQSLMRVGNVAGTPPYMAPEQWRGEELDVRADLYAVGCILYEMLIGRWPYEASSSAEFEQAHLRASVPLLPSGFPSSLALLIERCLAKARGERYGSAAVLAAALGQVYVAEVGEAARVLASGAEFDATDYSNRGVTYANLDQLERAIQDYDRAIALQPDFAQVYSNRGSVYVNLGQSERAIQDCDRAIALQPDFAKAYINKGAALANVGRLPESLVCLEQAERLGNPRGREYAERVRQALGQPSEPADPTEETFEAFQQAASWTEMRAAVARFPVLTDLSLIAAIEQVIQTQVPPEQQAAFQQRLDWLRQIAGEGR